MKITQIRTDSFDASSGVVRVTGRKNHVISSDLAAKLDFEVTALVPPNFQRDDVLDKYVEDEKECLPAHISTVDVTVDDLIVNKALSSCTFRPRHCQNAWNHSPADRAEILPYVTEDIVYRNGVSHQSLSMTAGVWLDDEKTVVTEPNENRPFYYWPQDLNKLYIGKSDELLIHEKCARKIKIPEIAFIPANQILHTNKEIILGVFNRQQVNAIVTARPTNPADHQNMNVAIARTSRPMTLEYVEDNVYRTDNRSTELFVVVSTHLIENNKSATDDEEFISTGFFICPITFDIQVTFGSDGKGKTRAVSFDGQDITDEVIVGDFLKMPLKALLESPAQKYGVGANNVRIVRKLFDIEEIGPSQALFLPIRRYSYTQRVGGNDPTHPDNLPENTSGAITFALDILRPRQEQMKLQAGADGQELQLGFANQNEMYALVESEPHEDEGSELVAADVLSVVSADGLPAPIVPIFGAADANNVRQLVAFEIQNDELTAQINRLINAFPNDWHVLKARRSHRFVRLNQNNVKNIPNNAAAHSNHFFGWRQNGQVGGPILATEQQNTDCYFIFRANTTDLQGGRRRFIQGSFMLQGDGLFNAHTLAALGVNVDTPLKQTRQMLYRGGSPVNRVYTFDMDKPSSVLTKLIDFDPRYVIANARPGPEMMENGYVTPLIDTFYNFNAGEAVGNALRDAIIQVLTCTHYDIVTCPSDTIYPDLLGDKNVRRRSQGTITVEEPLLTFGGASRFAPSHIFSRMYDFPPIIQDFKLEMTFSKFLKRDDCTDIPDTLCIFKPQSDTLKLETISKNKFDQRDKSLQTINERLCDSEIFSRQFDRSTSGVYKIPFSTVRGPPSYVFIRMVRKGDEFDAFSNYPPQFKKIGIRVLNQDVKTLSCLSEYRLKRATVQNSNVRCDSIKNLKSCGGILLSSDDLCKWVDFNFYQQGDTLDGEFVITDDSIRDWPIDVLPSQDAKVQALLKEQPIEIRILFLYTDFMVEYPSQSGLMEFKYPEERMSKLIM